MNVRMPEVDREPDFSAVIAEARKEAQTAADRPEERHLAIITPGRLLMRLPCPLPGSMGPEAVEGIRAVVPEDPPQVITCIAYTDVVSQGALDAAKVNQLIPFTGYLLGMAYVGHHVMVFEGHSTALSAGCAGADLLIVDGAMAEMLQDDWVAVAARVMRRPRILLFRREGNVELVEPSTESWGNSESARKPKKRKWWPF